jgi:hypothetical protein
MKLIHLVYIKYLSFLFTHPYGCDHLNASASFASFSFRFTHLCEVRLQVQKNYIYLYISIHAPLRGATYFFKFLYFILYYFNSRTSARCDTSELKTVDDKQLFQFTHLCEVRQHTCQSLAMQGLKWHFVRTPNHFTKFIDISPCKPQ